MSRQKLSAKEAYIEWASDSGAFALSLVNGDIDIDPKYVELRRVIRWKWWTPHIVTECVITDGLYTLILY